MVWIDCNVNAMGPLHCKRFRLLVMQLDLSYKEWGVLNIVIWTSFDVWVPCSLNKSFVILLVYI